MAKDKNFKINRNKGPLTVSAEAVRVGDMFEREGSLHMRVCPQGVAVTKDDIYVCNLNTGAVFMVNDRTECYVLINNCEINYHAA